MRGDGRAQDPPGFLINYFIYKKNNKRRMAPGGAEGDPRYENPAGCAPGAPRHGQLNRQVQHDTAAKQGRGRDYCSCWILQHWINDGIFDGIFKHIRYNRFTTTSNHMIFFPSASAGVAYALTLAPGSGLIRSAGSHAGKIEALQWP